MKEPTLNKEIVFKNSYDYLKNLFNELKNRKVYYYKTYSPFINQDLGLSFSTGFDKNKKELDDFETLCYSELERVVAEWKELNNPSQDKNTYKIPNYSTGRRCEICGKGTKDVNTHICDECKEKLKRIIYD